MLTSELLKEIYREHWPSLIRYARKQAGEREMPEDLVQDVFLKLWVRREHLPLITSWQSYLMTMLRNEITDKFRRERVRRQAVAILSEAGNVSHLDDRLLEKEYATALLHEIDNFPPQQARVFAHCLVQGKRSMDTAVLMNISPRTVKRHLGEVRRKVREIIMN